MSLEKPEEKSTYFSDEKHIKSDIDAMEVVTAPVEKGKRKSGMFS